MLSLVIHAGYEDGKNAFCNVINYYLSTFVFNIKETAKSSSMGT